MVYSRDIKKLSNNLQSTGHPAKSFMKTTLYNYLVSIITPTFNRTKYLEECIQSVLHQTYPYIEHIIVDGGSKDSTLDVLKHYSHSYPNRITYISEPDKGAGEAFNKGIRMARGDIFGWLCSDDLYQPNAIQAVVEFFQKNPNAYFVHGGCCYINDKGEMLYTHKPREFSLDELINVKNFIAFPSAFYKRTVVEKVGGLDTYGNDYDYMIRIAKVFQIYHIDQVLSSFRVHPESETGSLQSYYKVLKKDYHVVKQHGGRLFARKCREYYKLTIIKRLGLLPLYTFILKIKKRLKNVERSLMEPRV